MRGFIAFNTIEEREITIPVDSVISLTSHLGVGILCGRKEDSPAPEP